MERFSKFKKEMQSLKITGEEHYLIPGFEPVKVEDAPGELHGIGKVKLLRIEVKSREELNRLYSDAIDSLILLDEKQLRDTLLILKQFEHWPILKRCMEFYVKFHRGEHQPMDEMDLKISLGENFICTVTDAKIDYVFLDQLIDEVSNKKGLYQAFIRTIDEMLGNVLPKPGELFTRLSKPQTERLHRRLIEENFMECDYRNFEVIFGGEHGYPQPIKWKGRGYSLRKLLVNLKREGVTDKTIIEYSKYFFVDEKNEPPKVPAKPNNRDENIKSMKILTEILEKLATLS